MVVFAVLVALAVEQWREDQERQELADRATAAVVAEIQSNLEELRKSRAMNEGLLEMVIAADQADELPDDFNLTFDYSILSTAAWETARVTQATHYMPLERVQSVAKSYNLQELFERSQDEVMDFILNVGPMAREDPNRIPSLIRGPLTNAIGMEQILSLTLDSLLVQLEGAG